MNSTYERRRLDKTAWRPITFITFKREVWAHIRPGSAALSTVKQAWLDGKTVTAGNYEYRHRFPQESAE